MTGVQTCALPIFEGVLTNLEYLTRKNVSLSALNVFQNAISHHYGTTRGVLNKGILFGDERLEELESEALKYLEYPLDCITRIIVETAKRVEGNHYIYDHMNFVIDILESDGSALFLKQGDKVQEVFVKAIEMDDREKSHRYIKEQLLSHTKTYYDELVQELADECVEQTGEDKKEILKLLEVYYGFHHSNRDLGPLREINEYNRTLPAEERSGIRERIECSLIKVNGYKTLKKLGQGEIGRAHV